MALTSNTSINQHLMLYFELRFSNKMVRNRCSDIKICVCILTVLFGMGSWIAINGILVELPVLITQLPEGWSLPTYMMFVIQAANIAPLAYTVWSCVNSYRTYEIPIVFLLVSIGSTATLLLAFLWRKTSYIGNAEHSTALLVLMFFLSLVDCSSSVVFLPFMNKFKPEYITTYYIGEGFSALVPSLAALAQGVGQTECRNKSNYNATLNISVYSTEIVYQRPNFEVRYFFLFTFAMMIVCGLAFVILNYLPHCKTEHITCRNYRKTTYELKTHAPEVQEETEELERHVIAEIKDSSLAEKMSVACFVYYLMLLVWVNALTNAVLLSIQPYACLPYGSRTYHFAATLSNISNPAACFVALFVPIRSAVGIGISTLVGTLVSCYIIALASGSPTPVLAGTRIGAFLAVAAYVVVYLTLTYTKVSVARLFRREGRKALLWCGAITQLGSAIGTVVMFVAVSIYQVFEQKDICG